MKNSQPIAQARRFENVSNNKSTGSTYTPSGLADFVAFEMFRQWDGTPNSSLRILDPAVGEGELLTSLLRQIPSHVSVEVYGFDNNKKALDIATTRLRAEHPKASLHLVFGDFLEVTCSSDSAGGLFGSGTHDTYDLIIANPPYVRTQIMGASSAKALAVQFGLTGRVDLYHAFLLAIAKCLRPDGVAGIIVSNRFMTTKAGATVRRAIGERLHLRHVWDLGDTKLFDAAVLPAVLIAEGLNSSPRVTPTFTSIYETKDKPLLEVASVFAALSSPGVVVIPDGRRFRVQHGLLNTSREVDGIWRVATKANDDWLATVENNTWATFGDLGKVRVGVKTCADQVFIRSDWETFSADERPEILRPLTTHHIGRRFRPETASKVYQIVYPHEFIDGKRRTINLSSHPNTHKYLSQHRNALETRSYVIEAGRQWYEIWVPQDPSAWSHPKLVFRDISEKPCFWIDLDQTIVNGDCYWLICENHRQLDLLWLAVSVGNSTFIEAFYDHCFNNKLYAGRRRFITQYVEKFPLPDPGTQIASGIILLAKRIYETAGSPESSSLQQELDLLVWKAFGLTHNASSS